jgi:flagellar motor protein MotB
LHCEGLIMASEIVNVYSDALFKAYNRPSIPINRGSQNGWPYFQTETLLRIFEEAAKPHISSTPRSANASSSPSPPSGLQSHPIWLQTVWPVCVAALVVVCCVLALGWSAHRQALANSRLQHQDAEIAKMWREAVQQVVQSHLAKERVLNGDEAAFATSHAQTQAGLEKLSYIDTQIAASASTQASAIRELTAAQKALAQETTDLMASLRQTVQQGLADAAGQRGADTMKLQTQVAELAASQKALLDRLSESTNVPNLALTVLGVKMKTFGNSILLTFDDGLFIHGTYFRPDAKSRLQVVAKALAQVSTPLRIEVIGCADDDRTFKSWTARFEESLALDRATAVVSYFIELGLFAPKRLAALSSGATNRPFPSDTAQNRAKNRTATLRISTDEDQWKGAMNRLFIPGGA